MPRQLLPYVAWHLQEDEHRALMLGINGSAFGEIAWELGLGEPEAAQKQVQAAIAGLRRKFAGHG